jgi:hypothetical protein
VDWVEPSAQNTIPNSNNPSHKKASCAEIFSVLVSAEVPGLSPRGSAVCRTRPFSGRRGGINTSPLRPQRSSSSFFHSELDQSSLPLSLSLVLPIPCSNPCDSLRDLVLESERQLVKITLLCSCALGEALAAWCVHYSWSLAPRRLEVARELPTCYG